MNFTIIDSTGEPVSSMQVPDLDHLAMNIQEGQYALEGECPPDSYYLNEAWVAKPVRPSNKHTWNKVNKVWEDLRPLKQLKVEKRVEINLAREAFIDAPLETPYGVFDSDPKARTSITDSVLLVQTMQSLGTPTSIDFTLFDNSTVTLDTMGMITVGLLLGQKVQAAHARSRLLKAQIDGASIEELSAIQWNSQP